MSTTTNNNNNIKEEEVPLRFNHPDDLHKIQGVAGFGNLKRICTLGEAVEKQKLAYQQEQKNKSAEDIVRDSLPNSSLDVTSPPRLFLTQDARWSYVNNKWADIKKLQDQANADLQPLMTNFRDDPSKNWVLMQDQANNQEYYVSHDNKGNMAWVWCQDLTPYNPFDPNLPNISLAAPVQYGAYSATTKLAGVHTYRMGLSSKIGTTVAASIVTFFVSNLVKQGINFVATNLASMVSEAALEAGMALVFTISASVLTAVACAAVFVIVFIGISFLWSFLNKQFQILTSVYNWSEKQDYIIRNQALSNCVVPGINDVQSLSLTIPKSLPPGPVPWTNANIVPINMQQILAHTTFIVISYAYIVYENTNTFIQGCSFAFNFYGAKTGDFVNFAFTCPFWSSNGQCLEVSSMEPDNFLSSCQKNNSWKYTTGPLKAEPRLTTGGVTSYIDALTGGDANGSEVYQVAVHLEPIYLGEQVTNDNNNTTDNESKNIE